MNFVLGIRKSGKSTFLDRKQAGLQLMEPGYSVVVFASGSKNLSHLRPFDKHHGAVLN